MSEGFSARRFVVAGVVLVGGFLFSFALVATFHWFPYYWQWLAYHNGLVVGVIIYLLLSAPRDGLLTGIRPSEAVALALLGRATDSEAVLLAEWE